MDPGHTLGAASLDAIGAGVAVLTLIGEFHHRETRELVRGLGQALDGTYAHLVVDMRGVTVFGALGLRALVKGALRARERGIGYALVRPEPEVWRPFELTFLDQQLTNAATLEAAVAALTEA
jgi:anti-sigma B factor antagonist